MPAEGRKHQWLHENWYRDVWLFLITLMVVWAAMVRQQDLSKLEHANADARYGDCVGGNDTRASLRRQVEQNRIQRPFLLKLLPQFDKPDVLALIEKNEREELAGFQPRNCIEYAEEALPGHRKRYTLRISG